MIIFRTNKDTPAPCEFTNRKVPFFNLSRATSSKKKPEHFAPVSFISTFALRIFARHAQRGEFAIRSLR